MAAQVKKGAFLELLFDLHRPMDFSDYFDEMILGSGRAYRNMLLDALTRKRAAKVLGHCGLIRLHYGSYHKI